MRLVLTLSVTLVLLPGLLPAWAAPPAQDGAVSRLGLGKTTAIPGSSVAVPVNFNPGEGVRVSELLMTVQFRSSGFNFEKVEQSPGSRQQSVLLVLEDYATSGQGRTETSTLKVRASIRPGEEAEALPEGMIGALSFRVHGNHEGGPVDLKLLVEAREASSGTVLPQQAVRLSDGEVWVQTPSATPGCFFFTH